MSALPSTVTTLTSMYEAYIRAGFALVPITEGKGPKTAGWNKRENCVTKIEQLNPTTGYGLAHAYSGTMALDIDHWAEALALLADHSIDLKALTEAPNAVMIDSGNPGHAKLLYCAPLGLVLPSKKINFTAADKSKQVAFELRCATNNGLTVQDVLPSALNHPRTGRPYRWTGAGHFSKLPELPIALLTLWQELTHQDSERSISTDTVDASWHDIQAALYTIPADCSRDQWLTALMAVHHAGVQSGKLDQAETLAHEWSATAATKYQGPRDFGYVWSSLKADNGIKTGSLFHLAHEYGYKRPTPDVSQLFKSVIPTPPVKLVEGMRAPPPHMDMSLWPDVIAKRAEEISESMGCDPLVPLFAGLAAVCAAVDARTRLELMHGYQVPPLLWLMTIGDPADKKTPGARPMLTVLHQLEKEDRPRFQRSLLEWEALDSIHQQSKKAYIVAAGQNTEAIISGKLDNESLPPVAAAPTFKPVEMRLIVEDITSQKLVRVVADRPRGVMCHLDEMRSWVQRMSDPRSGEDRSCWTKSYESDPYRMDRVGEANSIYAENMAVAIYGNIQPAVFKDRLRSMSDDGLLQRFIPAILREDFTKRGEPLPDMLSTRSQWEMRIRELYALPALTYRLDSQAYEAFRDFQLWYERTKRDERILKADAVYMQAFGKLEGTTGRLALIVHLLNDPYTLTVPLSTVNKVIKIIKSYVVPAYRYALGETAGLFDDSIEKWVTDRIVQLAGLTSTVTLSELRRAAKVKLAEVPIHTANQKLTDAMETLEESGWVTLTNDHKDRRTWAINPNLAIQHEGYRLDVLKAKQRRQDESTAIARNNGFNIPRKIIKGYDPATMD